MSGGALIFMVLIAVAGLFEAITKKRTGQGQGTPGAPPRPRDGGPALPPSGPPEVNLPRPRESAQVLLPDELWAILTGEQRPAAPRPPLPPRELESAGVEPLEAEAWEDEAWEDEAEEEQHTTLTGEPLELRGREARELTLREERELALRPREELQGREPREIISLDDHIPTGKERHDAFHRRLDGAALAKAPEARTAEHRARRQRQLQRAIILREVLGPPRGLEDPF